MDSSFLQGYLDDFIGISNLNNYQLRFSTAAGGTLDPNPPIDPIAMQPDDDPNVGGFNAPERLYTYEVFIPRDTIQSALTATGQTLTQIFTVGSVWEISQGRFGDPWIKVRVKEEVLYGDVGFKVILEMPGIGETL